MLQAAVALLAEHGYGGCSVAAVARRAKIATGSVYQHFSGKAELSVALFRTVVGREVAAVGEAAAAAAARGEGPHGRVAAVVETFAARALRAPRLAYALLAEPAEPLVDAERLVFRRAFRDLFAEQIRSAVATGQLPAQNAEMTAAALVGAVGEALVGPLAAGSDPDDVIPALVSFALRALGGDREDPATRSH